MDLDVCQWERWLLIKPHLTPDKKNPLNWWCQQSNLKSDCSIIQTFQSNQYFQPSSLSVTHQMKVCHSWLLRRMLLGHLSIVILCFCISATVNNGCYGAQKDAAWILPPPVVLMVYMHFASIWFLCKWHHLVAKSATKRNKCKQVVPVDGQIYKHLESVHCSLRLLDP